MSYNGLLSVKVKIMPEIGKSVEIDDVVWQAWLTKNSAQNRLRYVRRLKAMALLGVVLIVSALLWRFIG